MDTALLDSGGFGAVGHSAFEFRRMQVSLIPVDAALLDTVLLDSGLGFGFWRMQISWIPEDSALFDTALWIPTDGGQLDSGGCIAVRHGAFGFRRTWRCLTRRN